MIGKKKTFPQDLGLCVFPDIRQNVLRKFHRIQYGAAMLVELFAPPTWRPENTNFAI